MYELVDVMKLIVFTSYFLLTTATFLGLCSENQISKWSFSDKYSDFSWSSRHNQPWTSCATLLVLLWFLRIVRQSTWYQLSGLILQLITDWCIDWLTVSRVVLSVQLTQNTIDTNWPTDQLNNSLDVWLTDWLTDLLTYLITDTMTDWLFDWLTNWLTGWLADSLSHWVTNWFISSLLTHRQT